MVTFVSILLVGAVTGWTLEQSLGENLLRWGRQKRMQMRIVRRQGGNPWRVWLQEEEE